MYVYRFADLGDPFEWSDFLLEFVIPALSMAREGVGESDPVPRDVVPHSGPVQAFLYRLLVVFGATKRVAGAGGVS